MGLLVENSSRLILSVALRSKGRKCREEDGAVGDEAGRRDGVGEDVGTAARVWVVAVGSGLGSRAAAVG
jgi:hypothetical protein